MTGVTGGRHGGRRPVELRRPGAAGVDHPRGRNESKIGGDAEHAARVALDAQRRRRRNADAARFAGARERAAETAVVNPAFVAHEKAAGYVPAEPRLRSKHRGAREQFARDAARFQHAISLAQSRKRGLVARDVKHAAGAQHRVDAAGFAHALDERRILSQ